MKTQELHRGRLIDHATLMQNSARVRPPRMLIVEEGGLRRSTFSAQTRPVIFLEGHRENGTA